MLFIVLGFIIVSTLADGHIYCWNHHYRDCFVTTNLINTGRFGRSGWRSQPYDESGYISIYSTTPPAGVITQTYTVAAPSPTMYACGQRAENTNGHLAIVWCDEKNYGLRAYSNFFGVTPTQEEMCQNGWFDGVEVWYSNHQDRLYSVGGFELLCYNIDFTQGTKTGENVRGPKVWFGTNVQGGNYWYHTTQMIDKMSLQASFDSVDQRWIVWGVSLSYTSIPVCGDKLIAGTGTSLDFVAKIIEENGVTQLSMPIFDNFLQNLDVRCEILSCKLFDHLDIEITSTAQVSVSTTHISMTMNQGPEFFKRVYVQCFNKHTSTKSVHFTMQSYYPCQDELKQTTLTNPVPNIQEVIVPVDISAYKQTVFEKAIFSNYLENTDTANCLISQCQLFYNCDLTKRVDSIEFMWTDISKIYVNTDPMEEFYFQVCLQCSNRNITVESQLFTIQADCTNNIDISVPDGFNSDQIVDATTDLVTNLKFLFSSFKTTTSACQCEYYQIYTGVNSLTSPFGLKDYNPLLDTHVLRFENSRTDFFVEVMNRMNPKQYTFVIFTKARGGSTFFTNVLKFTIKCPDNLNFITPIFQMTFKSFKGATGADLLYQFSKTVPELPMCTTVIRYSYIVMSYTDLAGVTRAIQQNTLYENPACMDPCLTLTFDVSKSGIIKFKIQPVDSRGQAPASGEVTITITENMQPPVITKYLLDQSVSGDAYQNTNPFQYILTDTSVRFIFDPFSCDTSTCVVTNYQISTTNTGIVAPTPSGVLTGPTLNSLTGKMEIAVTDTTILASFQIYVYTQLLVYPDINVYSNRLTISIVCGNEVISASQMLLSIPIYQKKSGFSFYQFSTVLRSIFTSSKSLCPITEFVSYPSISSSTVSQVLLENGNLPGSAKLKIFTTSGFRESILIGANTATVNGGHSKSVIVDVVVCGNELISPIAPILSQYVAQKNEIIQILFSFYKDLFSTSFNSINCHQDCTAITYSFYQGIDCSGAFTVTASDITINTSAYGIRVICIKAQTLGQQEAIQVFSLEVCGNEVVSVSPSSKPKVYRDSLILQPSKTDPLEIDVNYQFSSSSIYCSVKSFKLVQLTSSGYVDYTGSNLRVVSNLDNTQLKIHLMENQPFVTNQMFIQAATEAGINKQYLALDLKVCGYESITLIVSKPILVNLPQTTVYYEIDFLQFFKISDTDCGVNSYQLIYTSEIKGESQQINVDSSNKLIKIYPNEFSDTETTTISMELEATTKGGKSSRRSITVVIWSNPITLDKFNQAPNFVRKAQINKVLEFKPGEKFAKDISFSLPLLFDPEGDTIMTIKPIDTQNPTRTCDFNRTLLCPSMGIVNWIEIKPEPGTNGAQQIITFIPRNFELTEGAFTLKVKISDIKGSHRDGEIFFATRRFDYAAMDFTSLEEIRQNSIYFYIPIKKFGSPEECVGKQWKNITKTMMIFMGEDPQQKRDADEYMLKTFVLDQPISAVESATQEPIDRVYGRADGNLLADMLIRLINGGRKMFEIQFIRDCIFNTIVVVEGYSVDDDKCLSMNYPADLKTQKSNINTIKAGIFELYRGIEASGLFAQKKTLQKKEGDLQVVIRPSIKLLKIFTYPNNNFDQILQIVFEDNGRKMKEISINDLNFEIFDIFAISPEDQSTIQPQWILDQNVLKIDYISSLENVKLEDTLSYNRLRFNCTFFAQDSNSIQFLIKFKDRSKVSQSIIGKDQIEVQILQNALIQDSLGFSLQSSSFNNPMYVEIMPLAKSLEFIENIEEMMSVIQKVIMVLQVAILIFNILLSKSLQDLWGMLNTQTITIHLMLFRCSYTLPGNVVEFNRKLSGLNQRDMYPTDMIYPYVFNFTETDSPIEHFEELGYGGANFVELSGSLLINILIVLVIQVSKKILEKVCQLLYKYKFARNIGSKIEGTNVMAALVVLYLQGFLESLICTIISNLEPDSELYESGNASNFFSKIFSLISMVILVLLIFFVWYPLIFKEKVQKYKTLKDIYDFLYEDINMDSDIKLKSYFHVFFLLRRLIFVLIMIYLNNYLFLQLALHIILTLLYISFFLVIKPYRDPEANRWEVFNEICVASVSYILIIISDENLSLELKETVGAFYVAVCLFNLVSNASKIAKSLKEVTIPQFIKNYKDKKSEKQYQKQTMLYLEGKIEFCQENPNFALAKEIEEIATINKFLNQSKALLSKDVPHHKSVVQWLKKHDLPVSSVKEEYELLNTLFKEANRKQKRFNKLNTKIKNFFNSLNQEEVKLAVSDANHCHMRMLEAAPNFEHIMLSFQKIQNAKVETLTTRAKYAMKIQDDFQMDEENEVPFQIVKTKTPRFMGAKVEIIVPIQKAKKKGKKKKTKTKTKSKSKAKK